MSALSPPIPLNTEASDSRLRGSYWGQVTRATINRGGARFGLAWIVFLVVVAVLAPFIANTEPILVKIDGKWSSPVAHHLTPTDVSLVVISIAALVAWRLKRFSTGARVVALLALSVTTIVVTLIFVRPPDTTDWQEYRDLSREGKLQFKINALLPFSANDYQRDDLTQLLQPPSWTHPLGTEVSGADVLSRMIHATRTALAIGLVSTGISVVIGVIVGGLMGYYVGRLDIIGMRLIEIFEAIPTLFLLIMMVALFSDWGRNLILIMVVIGLTTWTFEARFIRAEFLRLRNQDFVSAAIASGLPLRSIIFRHLLPNGITPILVTSSFSIASAILYESTLSFLGLGPIDQPSWGQLLNQSLSVGGSFTWWIATFPGLAIFLTVFAYNLLGEALRDALDPKLLNVK